jgi:hypothetical protein
MKLLRRIPESGISTLRSLVLQTAVNLMKQIESFLMAPWDWRNIHPAFNIDIYNKFYSEFRLEKEDLIRIMLAEATLIYESIPNFVGAAEPGLSHEQTGIITRVMTDFQQFAEKYVPMVKSENWTDRNTLIE